MRVKSEVIEVKLNLRLPPLKKILSDIVFFKAQYKNFYVSWSSRSVMFCQKGVLKNFATFTAKHLCQNLLFNTITVGACNIIIGETMAQVFSYVFCEIFKNTYFEENQRLAASIFHGKIMLRSWDDSHKKGKDSLETRPVFSWILILTWNFGGGRSGSASTLESASWFWLY